MNVQSVNDVFAMQIADLYSAEQQLVQALPKVAQAASEPKLREALEHHLEQTRNHVQRLDQVMSTFGGQVPQEHCEGMAGLIKEGEEAVSLQGNPAARDAALIAAAQRVEHYEIAAYGTARTLAEQLDLTDAASLLDQTLHEEADADQLLTKIATGGMMSSGVNEQAQQRA
jgi:ferritin-like metal-binding protein YciE